MTEKIKVSDLPEFDAVRYLDTEEARAAYLADIREANNPEALAAALEVVKRSRRASSLEKIFAALDAAQIPADFMSDADRDRRPPQIRPALEDLCKGDD